MNFRYKRFLYRKMKGLLWNAGELSLVSFGKRPEFSRVYAEVGIRQEKTMLNSSDLCHIHSAVKATAKVEGDIAEVGVFRGGSARVICQARDGKKLHLFDTFEGLPEAGDLDIKFVNGKPFGESEFSEPIERVKDFLKDHREVHFYKGLFPETAEAVEDVRFSFVHMDVDLYQSTKDCLEFFYPRLNRGGIILSHDYPFVKGVKKAIDDFFRDREEPVVSLLDKQAMIVKL